MLKINQSVFNFSGYRETIYRGTVDSSIYFFLIEPKLWDWIIHSRSITVFTESVCKLQLLVETESVLIKSF